ncbi:hypothetical protein [Actinomyces sp. B33]|nr:hypothetical protein [Actinomyces sp. B33]
MSSGTGLRGGRSIVGELRAPGPCQVGEADEAREPTGVGRA